MRSTPAQRASRRLGSGFIDTYAGRAADPSGPDRNVQVSARAPIEVLIAVRDLAVPVRVLSLGGSWTFLFVALFWLRRRARMPFLVTGLGPGSLLEARDAARIDASIRFMLRPDAGPVWSLSRVKRRRGRRWIRIETPAGPGVVDPAHLRDATEITRGDPDDVA